MPGRPRSNRGYRYGRWHGGPDPLAPPYDLGNAVDEIGDSVLGGSGVREALSPRTENPSADRDARMPRRKIACESSSHTV